MLKTPISIKGPAGQLEALFAEPVLYQACKKLLNEPLSHWRHNEETQLTHACYTTEDEVHNISMAWPPQADALGQCPCTLPKPCVHLAALAIHNKAKLDQISPFTRQIKALGDLNQTFMNWLAQQSHDPFPNMARHRLIYVLDQQQQEWTIKLYKAYLTQEERYEVKAELSSDVLNRKQLPKFISLSDQYVLHLMHQVGLTQHTSFVVTADSVDVLRSILQTSRCFWKACYRPPLKLTHSQQQPQGAVQLTGPLFFQAAHNTIVELDEQAENRPPVKLPADATIMPRVTLNTSVIELDWKPGSLTRIDWLRISFVTKDLTFTLADVSAGLVSVSAEQLSQLAGCCYQLEKLPSVHARFEAPIHQHFDINDRCIDQGFTQLAPMLRVLMLHAWDIVFDPGFRLERQTVNQYVLDVEASSRGAAGLFDVSLGVQVNGDLVNVLPYLAQAIKTGRFDQVRDELLIKLDNGSFLGLAKASLEQIFATLNELYDERSLNKQGTLKMNQHQLMRLAELGQEDADGAVVMNLDWLDEQQLGAKVQALNAINSLPSVSLPTGLQAELRPYQQNGLAWLEFLRVHEFNGILADDMGLGKTLQVLTHVLRIHEQGLLTGPVLIVAPTSLLGNWQAECVRFTPALKSVILTGQHRQKQLQKLLQYDLVITSYGVMNRDRRKLAAYDWHTLVLDEAQAIKNRKTQVSRAAKALPAKHRLCLSGTPVENHLGEIWSLFEFLMPGFLAAEKVFQQLYQWPIEKDRNQDKLAELQQRLKPFILRRTKAEVATELPEKTEIIKLIELNEAQARVYESIRVTMADEIRQAVSKQKANPILVSNAMLRLRQICCHPNLLQLESIDAHIESAKLNWLMMVLPNLLEEGRRVLIFSSFTSMLRLIAEQLEGQQIPYLSLTGQTPAAQRTSDIAAFQAGQVPVYLISLKAGGAGVNLTAADTVIHYDPWWNPAAEQQASDRAHRIGQDKQVFVYKLITRGTIEERIHHLQQKKQDLAKNLLSTTGSFYESLDQQQWERLLAPIKS
jgi:non-specific serine/threonine protein kinase